MNVNVRALTADDWSALRDVRLEALRSEPGAFFRSSAEESATSEEGWRELLSGADRQLFGLFEAERLVGITAVFTDRNDPSGATALFAMSYIAPDYRGRGFSALLYEARLAWVHRQLRFARVVVSHRRSNEASRRANQRFGFAKTVAVSRTWPDGSVEDEVRYELLL